jgi:hypothetical protein
MHRLISHNGWRGDIVTARIPGYLAYETLLQFGRLETNKLDSGRPSTIIKYFFEILQLLLQFSFARFARVRLRDGFVDVVEHHGRLIRDVLHQSLVKKLHLERGLHGNM